MSKLNHIISSFFLFLGLPRIHVLGNGARAGRRDGVGVVRVSLPGDRAVCVLDDVLILDRLAHGERHRALPQRLAGGVRGGAESDRGARVPVSKSSDVADYLHCLAPGRRLQLLEGHGDGSRLRAAGSGGGGRGYGRLSVGRCGGAVAYWGLARGEGGSWGCGVGTGDRGRGAGAGDGGSGGTGAPAGRNDAVSSGSDG